MNYFEYNLPNAQRSAHAQIPTVRESRRPRDPKPGVTPEQVREAEALLACFETELEVAE